MCDKQFAKTDIKNEEDDTQIPPHDTPEKRPHHFLFVEDIQLIHISSDIKHETAMLYVTLMLL